VETDLRTSTERFEIDVATISDLPEILELASRKYGKPYNQSSFWKWRYFENPIARVNLYVVRTETNKLAAMQAVSMYSMRIDNEPHHAHILTAAFTAPEYRRRGLFRSLVEKIVQDLSQHETALLFTFPNKLSAKSFRGFAGWRESQLLSLFVRPLFKQSRSAASSDRSPRMVLDNTSLGIQVIAQDQFLVGGDEILTHQNAGLSFIDRSREYLKWRYNRTSTIEYDILHAESGNGHNGYLVLKPTHFKGVPVGLVADLAARSHLTANELLRAAVMEARFRGLRMLVFLVGRTNPYARALTMNGFVKWPTPILPRGFPVFTYDFHDGEKKMVPAVTDMQWYLTWGDTDVA
jgi:GNAT superfamily N-acetyltransferase